MPISEHRVENNSSANDEISTYEQRAERRSTPRSQTPFYKVMLTLNIAAWLGLVVALILFHYARPDFISGVQAYWGIKGDTTWSEKYVRAMSLMLLACLMLSVISMLMRARRTRRQHDKFGINLFVLLSIVAISLITIATTFGLFPH